MDPLSCSLPAPLDDTVSVPDQRLHEAGGGTISLPEMWVIPVLRLHGLWASVPFIPGHCSTVV